MKLKKHALRMLGMSRQARHDGDSGRTFFHFNIANLKSLNLESLKLLS